HRVRQFQRRIETVVCRCVSGLRIADNDRWAIYRRAVEPASFSLGRRADHHLGLQLRLFIHITGRLPDIDIALQDAAFAETADVGRGNVVELADARATTEL